MALLLPGNFFFCRTIETVCQLYEFYRDKLKEKVLADQAGMDVPENRVIAMYHSQSPASVKLAVSASLSDPHGVVRCVFATQSLSMGIDCPNIQELVHYGTPRNLESYICARDW